MRRRIVIFCVALLAALPLSAQIKMQNSLHIQMYLQNFHNMNPYSSPSYVGATWFFGELKIGEFCDGYYAEYYFNKMAARTCYELPYRVPGEEMQCYADYPRDFNWPLMKLPHRPDIGEHVYADISDSPYYSTVMVVDPEHREVWLMIGVFIGGEEGALIFDQDYSVWTYLITDKTVVIRDKTRYPLSRVGGER